MAVDSAQKRFSATTLLVPGYTPGVVPAGTIGAVLRLAVSWMYAGIAAGQPIEVDDTSMDTLKLSISLGI